MSLAEVDKIEREYFREIMNLPNDIKREFIYECGITILTYMLRQ
jgi:hypothetical protein